MRHGTSTASSATVVGFSTRIKAKWARPVFQYISLNCIQTGWVKLFYHLHKKYVFCYDPIKEILRPSGPVRQDEYK